MSSALTACWDVTAWGYRCVRRVIRLTPGDSLRLRQVQIAFQVAVHVDHASLLVGQHYVGETRLVQAALKARQHRDVLCQYQTRVSVVGLHPDVHRFVARRVGWHPHPHGHHQFAAIGVGPRT